MAPFDYSVPAQDNQVRSYRHDSGCPLVSTWHQPLLNRSGLRGIYWEAVSNVAILPIGKYVAYAISFYTYTAVPPYVHIATETWLKRAN